MRIIILIFFYIFFTISLVHSQENLKVNSIEAKELYGELRCLVCQNQSLLDSDAPLALDLKRLVLDKLEQGSSKEEIKEFLVERYGEFILLKPTFTIKNILLWAGPFIFVLFGVFLTFLFHRKTPVLKEEVSNLTELEKEKLKTILNRDTIE